MRVALIPGHDKFYKRGAVAFGISENEFWNDFINDLKFLMAGECIDNVDIQVFHRPNQKIHGYKGSMRILHKEIDEWNADLDIELHFNASKSPAKGYETLYCLGSSGGFKYANMIDKHFDKHLPTRDRGVKPIRRGDRGWYGIKIGKSYSILTEAFFGKELESFIEGGTLRVNLINAYLEFFKELGN